ncbi:MAG: hypothetical protein IJ583_09035, partial [Firmicutes bacterium]|nr:hypothetical protein [Bacillota bacterium]
KLIERGYVQNIKSAKKKIERSEHIVWDILEEVIDGHPVMLNRAPTLHRLSMRSYKVRLSDDDSIGVNPLSAEGFNFDHDGDTMAVHVPLGEGSIREMNELLDVKKNLYIPASGKVTLMPKQELVYGLNIISSSYKNPKKTKRKFDIKSDEELISVFENYDASVYALIEYKGVTKTLGEHLIDYIFPKRIVPLCKDIKKGKMSAIMEALSKEKENVFKRCADRIVKIAYTAATIYPPCISIINDYSDKASINDPFQDFEQQMSIYRESYHNGYDNSKTYNSIYTEIFEKTADKVTKNIEADMGYDNGFVRLVTCGARGNKDNLQQIVSFKGRIAKSATESFNAVITSSYLSGLSGLEHFIAAYGSRKSLIDKVRKPAETGDASRRMMHTAIDAGIVSSDCGTNEGIEINADKLTMYAQPRAINDETVEEMLASILEGRYEAGNSAEIITRAKAKEFAAEMMINRKKSVIIRSPITCRDKYCSKCYGVDLTINRRAVRGLPIGAIAAQSIGEPGTQLSMRTFHKGGVSSSADITSDFDKVKAIINMVSVDVSNPQYDPIAWESGEVHIKDCGDYYSVRIGNSEKSLAFKNKPYFKKSVEKGESLSALLGSCNISEIEEYGGIKKALEYMIFSIFTIYFSQATVNLKHIEVLTSEMVKYVVVESKGGNIPIGTVLDCREYKAVDDKENYTILPKLYNSLNAPLIGENFLKGMSFSYFKDVYSAALIMGKEDSLKNAFSRIMMGLAPLTGTSYPNYLRERKEAYEEDIEIF